jgi:ubiquinone biosynthesis accessory factor UbiK
MHRSDAGHTAFGTALVRLLNGAIANLPSAKLAAPGETTMNHKIAEDLMSKFSDLLAHSPAKDLERNVKALLTSFFSRMDLVTREEFDLQRELLMRTREKLDRLEAKLTALEQQASAPIRETPAG